VNGATGLEDDVAQLEQALAFRDLAVHVPSRMIRRSHLDRYRPITLRSCETLELRDGQGEGEVPLGVIAHCGELAREAQPGIGHGLAVPCHGAREQPRLTGARRGRRILSGRGGDLAGSLADGDLDRGLRAAGGGLHETRPRWRARRSFVPADLDPDEGESSDRDQRAEGEFHG
jgi:hypothetical protein